MKPVVLIIIVVVIGGAVVGAGMTGMVNIPGLTPAKKKANAAALYGTDKDKKDDKLAAKDAKAAKPKDPVPAAAPKPKPKPKVEIATTDPTLGYKKIAKLWNAMDAAKIKEQIGKGWKDDEIACVFNKMNTAKVAEVLALLDAAKAAKLTKALQAEASKLPPVAAK